MRVGRDESELRGELLGRTSCVSTDVWMTLVSVWSLCAGSTTFSGSLSCSDTFHISISLVAGSRNVFMWAILRILQFPSASCNTTAFLSL